MAIYRRGSIKLFFRNDPSVIAYYTFDNESPNLDESGQGNHLTANGAVLVSPGLLPNKTGKSSRGGAGNWGASNIGRVANVGLASNSTPCSILCWATIVSVPGTNNEGGFASISTSDGKNELTLWYRDVGGTKYIAASRAQHGTGWNYAQVAQEIKVGQKVLLLLTWDGQSTGNIILGINGKFAAATTQSNSSGPNAYGQGIGINGCGRSSFPLIQSGSDTDVDEIIFLQRVILEPEFAAYYRWATGIEASYFAGVLGVFSQAFSQVLTETITITDTCLKMAGKVLTQTITITDSIIRTVQRVLSESITVTNVLTALKVQFKTLSESSTIVDTIIKTTSRTLSEAITITDAVLKTISRTLSQAITITDTLLKMAGKVLTQSITITDTIIKMPGKVLTQTVTITDTVLKTTSRLFTETISVVDVVLKMAGKVLTESVSVVDTVIRIAGRVLSEASTITDTVIHSVSRTLSESISIVDTIIKTQVIGRVYTETIIIKDKLTILLNGLNAFWHNKIVGNAKSWLDKLSRRNNHWEDKP